MFNWKLLAIPLVVIGVIAAILAVTPFNTNYSVSAAPPEQQPTPQPVNAEVIIVPVAANRTKDPNVFTATVKIMTDTKVGESSVTIAMGATGLSNVPINVPVHVQCKAADEGFTGTITPTWTLYKPADSKAELKDPKAALTEFTPDLVGAYAVACSIPGGGKADGAKLHAGTYLGNDAENCKTCHPIKVAEWLKTGHATIFSDNIDNKRTPEADTHYTESCASCHTVGYYAEPYGVGSNGFKAAMTLAKWSIPTWDKINAAGKGGPSNFAAMPDSVKALANIQCEQCHGPATEHVKNGEGVMAVSQSAGMCNVCHNGSSRHDKGEQLKNAAHSDANAAAFNAPIGPTRQACVRCHSGEGYASFLKNPKNQAAWTNVKQTIVCATCHDPHSDANPWQLRIMGKPVELPFEVTKDVGLSATCFECHNSRANPANAIKSSFPHYSSVAEFLSDTGGVTYGQTVGNSPHGALVGVAPIPNPEAKDDPEAAKFLFSKAGDEKGNIPGPCVTCHMTAPITDQKDPNFEKVGGHSFNTVSPDGKFNYTGACKSCHQDIADFNFKAKADYDGNGKVEGVQTEVKGLLDVLWKALEAKGVKKVDTGYPYGTLPKGADGQTDDKIDNAWYNFRTVYGVMWGEETGNGNEGKAQAMHNFKRAVMLLQLSYKDLTGKDVPGATLMK
ncbi:MAG: hypothetical protein HY741_06080 [Chloroflexi bacterium]|nr:hypothetical protein [Chloroflexota bacterium]